MTSIVLGNNMLSDESKSQKQNLPYSIIQSESKTGLYIEQLGKIRTYSTMWNLVTTVNLTSYYSDYNELNKLIIRLKNECADTFYNVRTECIFSVDHLRDVFSELNEYDLRWFINSTASTRPKRGLLNIVGSTLKTLFGVLDENDAQMYLDQFDLLYDHSEIQAKLALDQTTLVFSAINLMNQSFAEQNDKIQQIYKILYESDYEQKTLHSYLNEQVQYIFMSLLAFQNKQKMLIDAISLSENNPNNPHLLPPKIFFEELRKILTSISARNLDLPFQLKTNAMSMFYRISVAEATVINGQLVICFKMPLVHTEQFDLFKATSLPYRVKENIFSYIVPRHEYIALDKFKDKYIPITNDELDNCFQLNNENLICKRTFPIMYSLKTKICEVILLRENIISDICNIRVTNLTNEIWMKMKQPNMFIFVLPISQPIMIACNNHTFSHIMSGTGLISIEPNCEVKSDTLILNGFEILTTVIYREIKTSIFIPKIILNLFENKELIKDLEIPQIDYPNIINNGQSADLEQISTSLNELRVRQQNIKYRLKPQNIKSDQYFIIIAVTFIAFLILIIKLRYIIKKVKKIRIKKNPTIALMENPSSIFVRNESSKPIPLQRVRSVLKDNSVTFEDIPDESYASVSHHTKSHILDMPNIENKN